MSSPAYIHVVKKDAIDEHTSVPVHHSSILSALEPSRVRVAPRIVALTYNNLSYARLGRIRNWWDAYPVPEGLPEPYGDRSQYGISPCWGHGEVLESKVEGVETGTLLWGYWPLSSLAVDLKLVKGDAFGHWIEVSEHRTTLMPYYNRYMVRDPALRLDSVTASKREDMAAEAVYRGVWECGYLLNKHVLDEPYIHPCAHEAPPDRSWSAQKGDLSDAVVLNLSAGGRTSRSFADSLINDRETSTGPLGLLAITGKPYESLVRDAPFPAKVVSYDGLSDSATFDWIAELKPGKIIINDFGGRGNSLFELNKKLNERLPSIPVHIIGVGVEPQPWTQQELLAHMQKRMAMPNREQMNTGPVRDARIAKIGAEVYFAGSNKAWAGFVGRGNLKQVRLLRGEGVKGGDGIDGGWEMVSHGKLPSDAALVYDL
jgi:hypothetical protein